MPELPEVETVVREIRPLIEGRTIQSLRVSWPRSLGDLTPRVYGHRVRGCVIHTVRRRAKYFLFDLTRNGRAAGTIVGHLRMSGRLSTRAASELAPAHTRVSYGLDGARVLDFSDTRKFGRVEWVEESSERLKHLGPEPLEPAFTPDWLRSALGARKRQVKPLLLDQTFLAGLGNIYVDEALHRAGIHPCRPAYRVPRAAVERLHRAICDVLTEAIANQGSSFDQFYRTPSGATGTFQKAFRVYGRAGDPCLQCGGRVRRVVVAQRGTHFCPRCQRAPRTRRST